jgi:hypothetical protein
MLQKREWAKINTSNSLNHGAGVMVRTNIPISLCSSHASQAHPTLAVDSGCQAAGDVIKKQRQSRTGPLVWSFCPPSSQPVKLIVMEWPGGESRDVSLGREQVRLGRSSQ